MPAPRAGIVFCDLDDTFLSSGKHLLPRNMAALDLLAERGIVGSLVLAVVLGFLLFRYARRLAGARGRSVFVPGAAVGVLALAALAAEAFMDASFLRPEVLVAAAAFLSVSASSFPPARKKAEVPAADGTDGKNA